MMFIPMNLQIVSINIWFVLKKAFLQGPARLSSCCRAKRKPINESEQTNSHYSEIF